MNRLWTGRGRGRKGNWSVMRTGKSERLRHIIPGLYEVVHTPSYVAYYTLPRYIYSLKEGVGTSAAKAPSSSHNHVFNT
jgi:hypothetical protein